MTIATVTVDDYFLRSVGALRKFELLNNQLVLHLSFNFRKRHPPPATPYHALVGCSETGVSFLHFQRRFHRRQ